MFEVGWKLVERIGAFASNSVDDSCGFLPGPSGGDFRTLTTESWEKIHEKFAAWWWRINSASWRVTVKWPLIQQMSTWAGEDWTTKKRETKLDRHFNKRNHGSGKTHIAMERLIESLIPRVMMWFHHVSSCRFRSAKEAPHYYIHDDSFYPVFPSWCFLENSFEPINTNHDMIDKWIVEMHMQICELTT